MCVDRTLIQDFSKQSRLQYNAKGPKEAKLSFVIESCCPTRPRQQCLRQNKPSSSPQHAGVRHQGVPPATFQASSTGLAAAPPACHCCMALATQFKTIIFGPVICLSACFPNAPCPQTGTLECFSGHRNRFLPSAESDQQNVSHGQNIELSILDSHPVAINTVHLLNMRPPHAFMDSCICSFGSW